MKNTLKIVLLNVALLFVLLIPLDWILGAVAGTSPGTKADARGRSVVLREWPAHVEMQRTPSDLEMTITQNLEQKAYLLRTDNHGFIVGPGQPTENQSADIIFFGGSTTECMYVDEALRFPYRVGEQLVDAQSGAKLQTLNGGKSGNHSMHSAIALLAKGVPLSPRVAVLMNNINDLSLLAKTGSYWDGPTSRAIVNTPGKYAASQAARITDSAQHSLVRRAVLGVYPNLYRLAYSRLGPKYSGDEWDGFRIGDANINLDDVRRQYRASLNSFVSIAKAWNIEPVLMTQFNRIRDDDEFTRQAYESRESALPYNDFVELYKSLNQLTRDVAAEQDILLIDLDRLVPATQEFIYDPAHVNNQGSELVAQLISRSLAERYANISLVSQ